MNEFLKWALIVTGAYIGFIVLMILIAIVTGSQNTLDFVPGWAKDIAAGLIFGAY